MTTPEQPRTASGQAWLNDLHEPKGPCYDSPYCEHGAPILAIEAEAQARPAGASEGLRAAIEQAVGKALYGWGDNEPNTATGFTVRHEVKAVTDAVLAPLASDAGSVGALNVRKAYTLLCSAEPALIRGVQQAPNETSLHYQQLLLDQVREWIAAYQRAGQGEHEHGPGCGHHKEYAPNYRQLSEADDYRWVDDAERQGES